MILKRDPSFSLSGIRLLVDWAGAFAPSNGLNANGPQFSTGNLDVWGAGEFVFRPAKQLQSLGSWTHGLFTASWRVDEHAQPRSAGIVDDGAWNLLRHCGGSLGFLTCASVRSLLPAKYQLGSLARQI